MCVNGWISAPAPIVAAPPVIYVSPAVGSYGDGYYAGARPRYHRWY